MTKSNVTNKKKKKKKHYNVNEFWTKHFNKVVVHSKNKFKYDVFLDDKTEYGGKINFLSKEIIIKNMYNKEELMTYLLLHELGHVILLTEKDYKLKFEELTQVVTKSSLSFRINVLYEEMDAWYHAYKLGKKLRIPIDRKRFETYKTRCLKTYMSWALETNNKKSQSATLPLLPIQIIDKVEEENKKHNNDNIHFEALLEDIITNSAQITTKEDKDDKIKNDLNSINNNTK